MSERLAERARRYINRELSWLEFDARVLAEAADPAVPLLERLRFLAISASNLDEFYMVRVGGLTMLAAEGRARRDIAGLTPREQLREIAGRVREIVARQYALFNGELEPALERAGIRRVPWAAATAEQARHAERVWEEEIHPQLTPLAVEADAPFPRLAGLTLHLALRLRRPADPGWGPPDGWAVVALPRALPRFIALPSSEAHAYLLLEDMAREFAPRLFPGCEILDSAVFRITRNADMAVAEDQAADLLANMEDVLVARRESECVRLEVEATASEAALAWLRRGLGIGDDRVVRAAGPLALSDYQRLADLPGAETLRYEPWPPAFPAAFRRGVSIFEQAAQRDLILYSPFENYEPVVDFIEEAAADPDVLAIKQILYRTSRNSPIVAALQRAAEEGKQVTALVELKARFDEERNIEWTRALERAGVQVICGIRGFKTHAKVCLVLRREAGGIRRYVHFGTGNYNERTARQYCDISLISAGEDYGADVSAFFNTITGVSQPGPFRRIEMAPLGLRRRLLELIEGERRQREAGRPARIIVKMNSLADRELIDALYRASQAGVSIDLLVRGICCLRPGVRGLSETIRVAGVVDRFLEHARIFWFQRGGDPAVFISSADWMPRNLDKRIELMVEVADPDCRQYLERVLDICRRDNVKAWILRPNGAYVRPPLPGGVRHHRSQLELYEAACAADRAARQSESRRFDPYRREPSGGRGGAAQKPPSSRKARPPRR